MSGDGLGLVSLTGRKVSVHDANCGPKSPCVSIETWNFPWNRPPRSPARPVLSDMLPSQCRYSPERRGLVRSHAHTASELSISPPKAWALSCEHLTRCTMNV